MWRKTKRVFPVLFLILLLSACSKKSEHQEAKYLNQKDAVTAKPAPEEPPLSYKKYKGAWFDIAYPFSFKAENSQKSSTSINGFDSAVFTSVINREKVRCSFL